MSLLSIYSDSLEDSIQRQLRRPAPPPEEPSFSMWTAMNSGWRAQVSGSLKTFGNLSDLLSGAATPYAASMYGDEEATKNMLEGNAFDVTAGNVLRRKADEYVPSPESSHWANTAIHGVFEFIPKAVGAVATMGPAGAVPLALDAGNTATQNLRSKGVDTETAAKVGAIEGVSAGVGAVLPIGAATKLGTAALAAGGGPGLFMAQEQASKKILERAGYMTEAEGHDPLDWRGLVMSAIPGIVIGGLHARNLGKIAQVSAPTEGAMKTASALTPAERAHSDTYERSASNLNELRGEIARTKDPATLAILNKELETQTAEAAKHANDPITIAANNPDIVDAARVKVTNDALHQSLPDTPTAYAEVMRASDELAAGRMPDVMPVETTALPEFKRWFGESKIVDETGAPRTMYHGSTEEFKGFDTSQGRPIFVSPDPKFGGEVPLPDGLSVQELHVKAANPFDFESPEQVAKVVQKVLETNQKADAKSLTESLSQKENWMAIERSEIQKAIKDLGHDGFYVGENGVKNLAVYDSKQVRPIRQVGDMPRSEGTNALPAPDSPTVIPEIPKASAEVAKAQTPGPSSTKSADIQATVEMRKRQSVLKSILECLES